MNTLTKEKLQNLSDFKGSDCVSIYIPTHRKGKEVNEMKDRRVLKNHYQDIKSSLKDRKGVPENEAIAYLEPINKLIQDREFWHHQTESLAVFLADNFIEYYHLPYQVNEYSTLEKSFYLMPLVSLFSDDNCYYLLSLGLNRTRLMEATRYHIREIEGGPIMKKGIDEIYHLYDFDKGIRNQSSSQHGGKQRTAGNKGGATFHGQGNANDDDKQFIVEYFQNVEEELKDRIINRELPLLLVGVDRLHPIFRENVAAFKIFEKGIVGNYEQMGKDRLHQMANETVEPYLSSLRQQQHERYQELAGTGKASYNINDIAPAAIDGRIDTLFVVEGAHRYGVIDPSDKSVDTKMQTSAGAKDLVSKAAVETVLNSGHTFFVSKEHLPEKVDDAEMAAIFRW